MWGKTCLAFILCETEEGEEVVFLSQLSAATLAKRANMGPWAMKASEE